MSAPRRRSSSRRAALPRTPEAIELLTDVLVIGGGPAGAWAALTACKAGVDVILADKGYLGTSGATAPSNTETWCVPPGPARDTAVARQLLKTGGLCDAAHVERVLDEAWRGLNELAAKQHPFAVDDEGRPYLNNVRGPDYMRHLRSLAVRAGVRILDHHPALELLGGEGQVAGAAGVDRQRGNAWTARAGAVVLATGGCAFGERFIGSTGLTGDGYLMAVEAGAKLSGMEYSAQYAVTPAGSSLNKGMPFRFARFFDCDGNVLGEAGEDRQEFVAAALRKGPVFARLDKADEIRAAWLRQGQPNCFLPFDRTGIDPFKERFEVMLRCEGTVRGVGGIRLRPGSDGMIDGATGVAGLYAAGDVVSRERLVGPVTGGGGPNSSWAIASGRFAGRAAAQFAITSRPSLSRRPTEALGRFGIERAGREPSAHSRAIIETVRDRMLPIASNFYRDSISLADSTGRFDELWRELPDEKAARRGRIALDLRSREAAALLATARWSVAAATERRESRGMHRRTDHAALDRSASRSIIVSGLSQIAARFEAAGGVS